MALSGDLSIIGCVWPVFILTNRKAGQAIVISYIVFASSGTPTGNVKVTDGTASCTGTVATGQCTLTPTSDGVKALKATYQGGTTFSPSVSPFVSHTVNKNVPIFLPAIWK